MQKQLLKLISIGTQAGQQKDLIEKTKLVNGISLMGVPICIFYALLFAISGHYLHATTFSIGAVLFSFTVLLNKWFGVKFGRVYISLVAPFCFGIVNSISGKDMGFFMGFIVTTMPAILIFDNVRQMTLIVLYSLVVLGLSIAGYGYCQPITNANFIMMVHLINLVTVIAAAVTTVFIFKRELGESRQKIEEKQQEILDSIHYAKKIQNALIVNKAFIDANLKNNFIYFKPKDIVSGDFYWATEHSDRFYLAVCDSTGHGVPGAFMSLLNITYLNEAINEKDILQVDEIFNYVREKLIKNLGKEGQKDGFDGILICVEKNSGEVSYAAANNAPVLITGGEVKKLPCCKMPVGQGEKKDLFVRYGFERKIGDTLYLYTDGFADQFGGAKGKKFMYKKLNELLLSHHARALADQKKEIDLVFEKWKGELEQVDDVLLVGIKF